MYIHNFKIKKMKENLEEKKDLSCIILNKKMKSQENEVEK